MALKRKRKEWACKAGCDLSSGKPCKHLEALLPSPTGVRPMRPGNAIRTVYLADLERLKMTDEHYRELNLHMSEDRVKGFRKWLKSLGLDPVDVEMLEDRFVCNLTFKEMCEQSGWTSVSTVHRRFIESLGRLKERIEWLKKNPYPKVEQYD